MRSLLRRIIIFSIVLSTGCGGGTTGTSSTGDGFNKVFEGTVVTPGGEPISGAKIRLLETGEKATTGIGGKFSLGAQLPGSSATFRVEKENASTEATLSNLSAQSSIVGLRVRLAEALSDSSNLELIVDGIGGGACDGLFNPAQVISFASDTRPLLLITQLAFPPQKTQCVIHLRIMENGATREGIGFQLLFVSLAPPGSGVTNSFTVVSQGTTDAGGNGAAPFELTAETGKNGYFVLEAPLSAASADRIGVVISLLTGVP